MKLPLVSGRETTGGGSFCPNVEDEIVLDHMFEFDAKSESESDIDCRSSHRNW